METMEYEYSIWERRSTRNMMLQRNTNDHGGKFHHIVLDNPVHCVIRSMCQWSMDSFYFLLRKCLCLLSWWSNTSPTNPSLKEPLYFYIFPFPVSFCIVSFKVGLLLDFFLKKIYLRLNDMVNFWFLCPVCLFFWFMVFILYICKYFYVNCLDVHFEALKNCKLSHLVMLLRCFRDI